MKDIYLGSDHAGYDLKQKIKSYLEEKSYKAIDLGVFSVEPPADYPDIAREVAEKVLENQTFGILICGTGIGMCITANRYQGIRAATCYTKELAETARKHNNANILCLGARVMKEEDAIRAVEVFLNTEFEGGRHEKRINKIDQKK